MGFREKSHYHLQQRARALVIAKPARGLVQRLQASPRRPDHRIGRELEYLLKQQSAIF